MSFRLIERKPVETFYSAALSSKLLNGRPGNTVNVISRLLIGDNFFSAAAALQTGMNSGIDLLGETGTESWKAGPRATRGGRRGGGRSERRCYIA